MCVDNNWVLTDFLGAWLQQPDLEWLTDSDCFISPDTSYIYYQKEKMMWDHHRRRAHSHYFYELAEKCVTLFLLVTAGGQQ